MELSDSVVRALVSRVVIEPSKVTVFVSQTALGEVLGLQPLRCKDAQEHDEELENEKGDPAPTPEFPEPAAQPMNWLPCRRGDLRSTVAFHLLSSLGP
jgi:hypothetical protein